MDEVLYSEHVKYNLLVDDIKAEFPKFAIIEKESSSLMKWIYRLSLMCFWNPEFMENYITVMFGKVYMPKRFIGTPSGHDILRHERVHLRDARRWPVIFELSYLFFPLPFVFTLRAYWEYRAYCESLIVCYERYGYVHSSTIEFFVKQFTGPYYLWMFPFPSIIRNAFYKYLASKHIKVR